MASNNILASMAVKLSAIDADFKRSFKQSERTLTSFQNTFSNVAKTVGTLFAADQLIGFGRQVFNVTAEFQKFEAVLTNTLGHNGAAKAALRQITEFAEKTPYAVEELTSSFVKLANQGFVPTLDQMRSLGDLASAMGKSFDQLTEAIIDAQTGEFERLKEFGIRAQKQGDKVTFTFKGVKTQVDFTADSIRQYILSLGDVEGVTGGMDAQSKTLGGTLSNLGDAISQVQLALGKLIEGDGLVSSFLNNFAEGAKKIAEWLGGPTREELEKTLAFFKDAKAQAWKEKDMKTWELANEAYQEAAKRLRAIKEGDEKLAEIQTTKTTPAVKEQAKSIKELVSEWDRLNHVRESSVGITNKDDAFGEIMNSVADKKSASSFVLQAERLSDTIKAMGQGLKVNSQEWAEWEAGVSARLQIAAEKIEMDFAPVLQNALSGIGSALGEALTGASNLGDSLLRVLGGIITQLGEMILAAGIGVEAFKKSLQSLNGVAAIAAGIGLIALGSAISSGISRLGGGGGGGSRPGSPAPGRLPSEGNIVGRSYVRGYTIATVLEKDSYRRGRLG